MAASAWIGRIENVGDAGNAESVSVSVSYYDAADTAFVTSLWQHSFTFEFGTPQVEMRAAIVALGQTQRSVLAKVAAAQQLVSTTVPVP